MAKIKESFENGDANSLERTAHALKGSVGNFGAKRSFEAAYRLEKMGKEKKLDDAREAFDELEEELAALETEMKKE